MWTAVKKIHTFLKQIFTYYFPFFIPKIDKYEGCDNESEKIWIKSRYSKNYRRI